MPGQNEPPPTNNHEPVEPLLDQALFDQQLWDQYLISIARNADRSDDTNSRDEDTQELRVVDAAITDVFPVVADTVASETVAPDTIVSDTESSAPKTSHTHHDDCNQVFIAYLTLEVFGDLTLKHRERFADQNAAKRQRERLRRANEIIHKHRAGPEHGGAKILDCMNQRGDGGWTLQRQHNAIRTGSEALAAISRSHHRKLRQAGEAVADTPIDRQPGLQQGISLARRTAQWVVVLLVVTFIGILIWYALP